ncbi:NYN domain-containing protein [Tengunoibacter tsumagoiensis]|uniref:RNA-binding protein n=1 Tax=Tengunoibacter tsumagoiensis TaxID=2014871 RepID=A0A402A3E4_9CHLR|nr:NYN domain-containing protein [Tengunoibacter tsumagoiensis]GCE13592.1 hypothetical protein KTT_34510 [Tengunoibacter tsumagoiensis]
MAHQILIDGYNVIKNNAMYQAVESKNIANARTILLTQLKNRYRHTPYHIIVVFDGNDKKEQISHDDHIRIIFSRYGETADSVIARIAREARQAGHTTTLYSDDGEVKESVKDQGGNAKTTHQLTTHLNAAPSDVATRSHHRQAMRRIYGIDPAYKDEEAIEASYQPQKGKRKHRAAKRHR